MYKHLKLQFSLYRFHKLYAYIHTLLPYEKNKTFFNVTIKDLLYDKSSSSLLPSPFLDKVINLLLK